MFTGKKVLHNFFWNIMGKGWGILLVLLYLPLIVRELGEETFGIYALLVVFLFYFKFLEFGFGRSLEKHGAEALGIDDTERVGMYFGTAFWLQAATGVLGVLAIWLTGPLLVPILKISAAEQPVAVDAMRILAVSFGFTIASNTSAGTLRAFQRFDLLNGLEIVAETLKAILSVAAVLMGYGLIGLMWALLIRSAFYFIALLFFAVRELDTSLTLDFNRVVLKKLFRFGGFVTLSEIIRPVLSNIEKVMMGAMLSMQAVTFYTVPFNVISRVKLIPGALSSALFPYLNALEGRDSRAAMFRANVRATELLTWGVLPIYALLWIAGDELLGLWMGYDFAEQARSALMILILGFFVNTLAHNSLNVIQACGKPELQTIFYAIEVVLYVPLAYGLITWLGFEGAAWAWTIRVMVDTLLVWIYAYKLAGEGAGSLLLHWKAGLVGASIIGMGYVGQQFLSSIWEVIGCGLLVALLVGLVGWYKVVDASIRTSILRMINRGRLYRLLEE